MRQPDVQGKQLDQDGIPRRDWFEREECSLVFERENNGLFRSIRSCVATRAGLILVVGAWRQRGGLVWPPVRCSRAHHSHPAWSVLQHTPPAPWAGSGQALRPTPLHPPTPHPRARPRCVSEYNRLIGDIFSCSYIAIFRLVQRVAGIYIAARASAVLAAPDTAAADSLIGIVGPPSVVAAGVDGGP